MRERAPLTPWRHLIVIAFAGTRGAISLAAALSLPLTTESGTPFPERDLIIFLTFGVIVAPMVLPGSSLPLLLDRLGPEADRSEE